jgi:hypothetical protein
MTAIGRRPKIAGSPVPPSIDRTTGGLGDALSTGLGVGNGVRDGSSVGLGEIASIDGDGDTVGPQAAPRSANVRTAEIGRFTQFGLADVTG